MAKRPHDETRSVELRGIVRQHLVVCLRNQHEKCTGGFITHDGWWWMCKCECHKGKDGSTEALLDGAGVGSEEEDMRAADGGD